MKRAGAVAIAIALVIYAALCGTLYAAQRSLLYYPTPEAQSAQANALRIEAGRRAWGAELSPDETPLEAGLSYAVALGKPIDFIGREALLRQREHGITKRLVQLTLDDPATFPWGGEPILMEPSDSSSGRRFRSEVPNPTMR